MARYRRSLLLILLASTTILLLLRSSAHIEHSRRRRHGSHKIGFRETGDTESQTRIAAPHRLSYDLASFQPVQDTSNLFDRPSPFPPGTPKPPGSIYTKAVVLGRLLSEDTSWLEKADLPSHISKFIYLSDNQTQPSTTPNLIPLPNPKGHEAMVYLTHIINNYATLADITIFLHAHQLAWHNDELLNHNALEIISRLSPAHVTRLGYMNLRCNWKPGCPEYLHPQTTRVDPDKLEESAISQAWPIFFPDSPLPDVLATPCCAQFALSRSRIRQIPLATFVRFRTWLEETDLDDAVSGRVFEYVWHRIFTAQNTVCPDMRACYCDGYGVCFPDEREFDYWFEVRYKLRVAEKRLAVDGGMAEGEIGGKGHVVDRDVGLQEEIDAYKAVLEEMRTKALLAGDDPRVRARVAGRRWVDGDGY